MIFFFANQRMAIVYLWPPSEGSKSNDVTLA